jgi:hypothetical protein
MTFVEFATQCPEQFRAALAAMPIERIAVLLDRGDGLETGLLVSHVADVAKHQVETELTDPAPFHFPLVGADTVSIFEKRQAD